MENIRWCIRSAAPSAGPSSPSEEMSIFGIGSKGSIGEAAGGVSLRFGWWVRLYDELTSDPATLLSGLGFGVPLTDFRDTFGVVAREPHNSIISVVARLGLVGGIAWIWLQAELFRLAYLTHKAARRLGLHDQAQLILLIMAFAALTLASCLGEDTLEKPYNAIPYYALWGVLLRIAYRIRVAEAGAPASSTTMTRREAYQKAVLRLMRPSGSSCSALCHSRQRRMPRDLHLGIGSKIFTPSPDDRARRLYRQALHHRVRRPNWRQ